MPRISLRCFKIEILVAPGLEFVVGRDPRMGVASRAHRGMKRDRVGIVLRAALVQHRRQVGAAAEPGLGRHHETRVHVHGRHVRIVQMRDQRDAGGPEARIVGGAGNILAEFRRELAEHGRDVHADLFEYAPLHHRHHAAAAVAPAVVGALPRRANEAARPVIGASGAPAGSASSTASNAAQMSSRNCSNQTRARPCGRRVGWPPHGVVARLSSGIRAFTCR